MGKLYGTETKLVLPEYVEERLKKGPVSYRQGLMEKYENLKPLVASASELFQVNGLSSIDLVRIPYLELNLARTVIDSPGLNLQRVDRESLQELRDFICLHRYSFMNEFQGTYGEILGQVPEDILENADYLQLVEWPRSTFEGSRYAPRAHLSRVMAYKLK